MEKESTYVFVFELDNTFGNLQVEKNLLMYSFSIRQYFWEYTIEKNPLMYSFSIKQYFWEYIRVWRPGPRTGVRNRSEIALQAHVWIHESYSMILLHKESK